MQRINTLLKLSFLVVSMMITAVPVFSQRSYVLTKAEIEKNARRKAEKLKRVVEYDSDTTFYNVTTFDREGRLVEYYKKDDSTTTYEYYK